MYKNIFDSHAHYTDKAFNDDRENMLGSSLYMCCTDPKTSEIISDTNSCMMCKKLIINAGISTVVIRDTREEYRVINVSDWITDDDSLSGVFGY